MLTPLVTTAQVDRVPAGLGVADWEVFLGRSSSPRPDGRRVYEPSAAVVVLFLPVRRWHCALVQVIVTPHKGTYRSLRSCSR